MSDRGESTDGLHPVDLLVAYLEGTLPPAQRESVAAHLSTCPACEDELGRLKEALALLEKFRSELCPEVSELYEFANFNMDEGGRIALHLASCPLCRAEVERLKPLDESHTMPEETWRQAQEARGSHKVVVRASRWFKPLAAGAVLAAASLAAAVCLMLLHPTWKDELRQRVEPGRQITLPTKPDLPPATPRVIIAMSSNTWDSKGLDAGLMAPRTEKGDERGAARLVHEKTPIPSPKYFQEPQKIHAAPEPSPSRPVATKVIILENFSEPLPAGKLRFFYDCIEPDRAQRDRFEFVTPRQLQEAHQKGILSTESVEKFLEGLRDHFRASQALFIMLRSAGDKVDIEVKLLDVTTGERSRKRTSPASPKIRSICSSESFRGCLNDVQVLRTPFPFCHFELHPFLKMIASCRFCSRPAATRTGGC